jgi:hypothetical protein
MVAESFKRSHKMIALCVALAFATAALALGFAVTADAEEGGSKPAAHDLEGQRQERRAERLH